MPVAGKKNLKKYLSKKKSDYEEVRGGDIAADLQRGG